jgi:acetylornithine deacetylase/succinyl-diaminopimelate desuccinylase-like protein
MQMLKSRSAGLFLLFLMCATPLCAQLNDSQKLARDIFKELIEVNTTHSVGNTTAAAQGMATRLRNAGFGDSEMSVLGEEPRSGNLVVRLRGTGARKPLLLLAHLDVVEAKREDWSVDPFKFIEKDGYFYGRGTSDIKDGDAILITTLIRLKQEHFQPDRDLIVALTAGEESGGRNGVVWLLENHRDLIDAEYCVNTDSGFDRLNGKRWAAIVEAAEKRAVTFQLEATDPGGHSSIPRPDNPIYRVSEGLLRISKYSFPVQLNETTRTFFERASSLQSGQLAADMKSILLNPPDTGALTRLSADPPTNALLRTTCVATQMEAGHALNALPQAARAYVNCRIVPGSSIAEVLSTLQEVVNDQKIGLTVFLARKGETPPPSPLRPDLVDAVEKVTTEMWPGVPVIPRMETGATDGFPLRQAGIPTYGVSGVFFDVEDNRAHGSDERVRMEDFDQGVEFFYRLAKRLSSAP